MNVHQANTKLTEKLLAKPETGMGFQVVNFQNTQGIYKGHERRFLALNADILIELNHSRVISSDFIRLSQIHYILFKKKIEVLSAPDVLRVEQYRPLENSFRKLPPLIPTGPQCRYSGNKGALDCQTEKADGKEIFTRLSAYENDRRIDLMRECLKPGSFTTTLIDNQTCKKCNDKPIPRYALPNKSEVKWAFDIRPLERDTLKRGVAQPDYGEPGGGIEAYFEFGTSAGTYLIKREY